MPNDYQTFDLCLHAQRITVTSPAGDAEAPLSPLPAALRAALRQLEKGEFAPHCGELLC